jgi:mRNA-degrading endonuclease RelE of RelBE toxin-antitoxin system
MKTRLTPTAVKSFTAAPIAVRRAFDKQTKFLLNDLRHPSLHAKKYDEAADIWQARIGGSISR